MNLSLAAMHSFENLVEAQLRRTGQRSQKAALLRTAIVIPAYRARETIGTVVTKALASVGLVIVVDDGCPEETCGRLPTQEPRLIVLRHEKNKGVGAAVKTAISEALRCGAEYIVKIDADNQMDVKYIPEMIAVLEQFPEIDMVKGNRFADASTVRNMPVARLIGNAVLTFLVKFASGYWTLVDPTNGYVALRSEAVQPLSIARLDNRFFFEIDLLCWMGLRRRTIAEMEMPAIYGAERSSLSIRRAAVSFPGKLFARFVRRVSLNYLVFELNVASVCAILGGPLLAFSLVFGGLQWRESAVSGVPRTTGTVILALLMFMVGFQLVLQALLFDVQFSSRTIKIRADHRRLLKGFMGEPDELTQGG
jgi:glycosyltransferase involved in cell wall biosynthesis